MRNKQIKFRTRRTEKGFIEMKDDSLMMFGKYAGYEMKDIPFDYLRWLYGMSWIGEHPNVMDYIERNRIRIGIVPREKMKRV